MQNANFSWFPLLDVFPGTLLHPTHPHILECLIWVASSRAYFCCTWSHSRFENKLIFSTRKPLRLCLCLFLHPSDGRRDIVMEWTNGDSDNNNKLMEILITKTNNKERNTKGTNLKKRIGTVRKIWMNCVFRKCW